MNRARLRHPPAEGGVPRNGRRTQGLSDPLHGPELSALRRIQRDYLDSLYVFAGERKRPLTESTVRKMVARAGTAAGLEFPVHPHMLRHAAGYKLANDGHPPADRRDGAVLHHALRVLRGAYRVSH